MSFYVRASSLHRCRLELRDQTLGEASLFPFFDARGAVEQLMVVDWGSRAVRSVAWRAGLVRPAWLTKSARVDAPWHTLDEIALSNVGELSSLWHFDPWWVLAEPPFDSAETTPILKATNCPGLLEEEPSDFGYLRDLSRVRWVFRGEGESETAARWDRSLLPFEEPRVPERPVSARAEDGRPTWVLRPFWQ